MAIIEEVTSPFLRMGYGVIDAVPGVLAAILVLIVGYIVAWTLARIVGGVLTRLKFDSWVLKSTNLSRVVGEFRLTHFLELITKWYVFILFLPAAANIINLGMLQNFLLAVGLWVPKVIVAVVLGLVGIMAADYVALKIQETKGKAAGILSSSAKVVILIFTAILVLDQIGVKIDFATNSLLIILSGVMLALALMFGIGFGLAMKDEAKKFIGKVKRKI